MFPFSNVGQISTPLPPGVFNATYVGIASSGSTGIGSVSFALGGTGLPQAEDRFFIGALRYVDDTHLAPASVTMNGVTATKLVDNVGDSTFIYTLAIYVANIGTTSDSSGKPGCDFVVIASSGATITTCSFSGWMTNMASGVAHSTTHAYDGSGSVHNTLAIPGVDIPANGFAVLLGDNYNHNVSTVGVDQGFARPDPPPIYARTLATAFTGTATLTWSGNQLYSSAIMASFAGDGN